MTHNPESFLRCKLIDYIPIKHKLKLLLFSHTKNKYSVRFPKQNEFC